LMSVTAFLSFCMRSGFGWFDSFELLIFIPNQ